jgi:hypothetical protein
MGRRKGDRNKKPRFALNALLDAEYRRESYRVSPDGQRVRMYRISENAVKQARYRVAKEQRDAETAARAWAHRQGVDFDKLSPTIRQFLPSAVRVSQPKKTPPPPPT